MRDLDELNSKELQQYSRMKFLDFLLIFRGWFTRQDLIEEFKVAPAGVTRDIAKYKKQTSDESGNSRNIDFNDSLKRYIRKPSFESKEPVTFESAISQLRRAFKKDYMGSSKPIPLELPITLFKDNVDTLSSLSRGIANESCLIVEYGSLSNGKNFRKIAPHAFFESEKSWYVRVFCYKRNGFRSFKLTRFSSINLIDEKRCDESNPINDNQWQRWVNLILEPHHERNNKDIIARECGMGKVVRGETILSECAMEVKVRAAICGYWLQHWNVDCSERGILGEKDKRYQLQLANPETLYDVESAKLAPGQ